ncbi:MAG: filamentous hemagglutinin N-terminal domain-containing protein, partial [Candidatus Omnitrophica bacterium]|nr:filamentous hemagglutinin N-terminal domain-containing protein [Candidatus Omnitrophota bacterium]
MKTKKMLLTLLALVMMSGTCVFALPQDAQVENGSVSIETPDSFTMNITASDKAIINFSSFNIGQNETVNFIQPNASASVLSRVTGSDASVIAGTLSANGILFLINPNGINFTPTANVNVNTLVASTLDIANNNFINGNYELMKNLNNDYAKILNEGRILGTHIALIGSAVENRGIIIATAGTIHLASGDKTVVAFDARGFINIEITEATSGMVIDAEGNTVKDAVANSGTLQAHQVFMSAKTAHDIFENAVNNTGIVKATKLVSEGGVIRVRAEGNIQASGTMEAEEGTVEIEASESVYVKEELIFTRTASIKAGEEINIQAPVTNTDGSISLYAPNILGNNNMVKSGLSVNLLFTTAENITLNTPKIELYRRSDTLYIENITDNDPYINILGEGVNVNYLKTADVTLKTDGMLNVNPGVIISAPTLTLTANQFGTNGNPIVVDTDNLNIRKTTGDINIVESTGIGTSILILGPPDESFGSILYNEDANISIYALLGSITIGENVSLTTTAGSINLETFNKNPITINGSLYAPNGTVRLWTCGLLDLRQTKSIVSKEGGYIYNTEDEVSVEWDGGASTNNWADAANWTGDQVPNTNAYRVTINLNGATVTTAADYTIGELNIGSSNTCSLTLGGTLTLDDADATLDGDLNIGANGTLITAANMIYIDGDFANSGTFTHGSGTVDFTKPSGTQTVNPGASSLYRVNKTGAGLLQFAANTSMYSFNATAGTLDFNAKTITITAQLVIGTGAAIIADADAMNGTILTVDGSARLLGEYGDLLTFNATDTWYLRVTSYAYADYVSLKYCDAGGYSRVDAAYNCTNSGYNTNILFNPETLYWIGGATTTSASWNNPANWSYSSGGLANIDGIIPTGGTDVIFDGGVGGNGVAECVINATAVVGSISCTSGYTGDYSTDGHFDAADNDNNISVSRSVTFANKQVSMGDGDWTVGGSFDFASAAALNCNLSLLKMTGTGNYNSIANTDLYDFEVTVGGNVTITNTGRNDFTHSLTIAGTLTSNGNIWVPGPTTLQDNGVLQSASKYIQSYGGVVRGKNTTFDIHLYLYYNVSLAPGTYGKTVRIVSQGTTASYFTFSAGSYVFNSNLVFMVTAAGNWTIYTKTNTPSIVVKGDLYFDIDSTGNIIIDNAGSAVNWTIWGYVYDQDSGGGYLNWIKGTGTITFAGTGSGSDYIDFPYTSAGL